MTTKSHFHEQTPTNDIQSHREVLPRADPHCVVDWVTQGIGTELVIFVHDLFRRCCSCPASNPRLVFDDNPEHNRAPVAESNSIQPIDIPFFQDPGTSGRLSRPAVVQA